MSDTNTSGPSTSINLLDLPNQPSLDFIHSINRRRNHRVAFNDWGSKDADEVTFCVHGLTRNKHDFDVLASRLTSAENASRRVVCPDLVGRGDSNWLRDPSDYNLLQYNLDFTVLASRTGAERYNYIGTSLGGLMGISLAGLKDSPIKRLVINDIAPEVPYSAITRLTKYIGKDPRFDSIESVEEYLRETLAPFGPMTDANWRHMAYHGSRQTERGYRLSFDPQIVQNFRRYWMFMHVTLWQYWDRIQCPVLILRGVESDFLSSTLADKMLRRLPNAELIEFEGVGHVPSLNSEEQIVPVMEWLARPC